MIALPDVSTILFYIFLGSLAVVFILSAFFVLGYGVLSWLRFKDREINSLSYVVLQIALPRDNEIKIDAAEQMFSALYSIKKGGWFSFLRPQVHLTLEIVALPGDIRFYISCPEKLKDLVEKQVNGAYPDAEVKEVPEYNIFSEEGKVAFAKLRLKNSSFNPIKVYKELPTDPLSLLTTALGKMENGEGAVVQILISPSSGNWRSSGKKYISKIKKQESEPDKARFSTDARTLEAIENKCSKPGFETEIRIVVCSNTLESAKAHLSNIRSGFEQFSSDTNSFKGYKVWIQSLFMYDFLYRYQPVMRLGQESILSSEELATIFHLPNKTVETPHIFWLNSKRAPAPTAIPAEGLYLGKSIYRGMEKPIYLSEDDRRRHVYIIGKTGTGKTELMKDLLLQDIRAGKGVCLIDPHDLAEDLLQYIPPERAEDVIFFDPSDYERPMGLNLLEAYTEQQIHMVASSIINLMYKLYDPYKTGIVGPRFEHAIRNAMLTVMSEPGATFVEVMRCLQSSAYVEELLPKVKDPIVKRFWTEQIAQTSDFHKSETLDYIVSKFGRFVTDKNMRNIIGQSKSSFDFRKIMDEGKILIISLPKGKMGEENSSFLGLVLVPKILMAAMSRQDTPEDQRRDFYLYVDEFQNFATPDFAQILSEARKYKLNLIVANQFVGQMEEEIKNAVFGNVGTIISFNIGVQDANFLQHWFQPVFNESDLMNIERYNAYVKTIVHNEPMQPFSMNLVKDLAAMKKQANPRMTEIIKEMSRLKYGRDRETVEQEIIVRARL